MMGSSASEGDNAADKTAGEDATNHSNDPPQLVEYGYDSPHDTPKYVRSLAKFYTMDDNPPSLLVAMTIGVPQFCDLLTSPPFSEISSKAIQESYLPISDVLKREILRRSHFLLSEIDNKKTDHPLRDASMRLRMPQPAQWNRDKLIKFLEDKVLDLDEKDVEFLQNKVDQLKVEVAQQVRARRKATEDAAAEKGGGSSAARRNRRSSASLLVSPEIKLAPGTTEPLASDAAEALLLSATGRGSLGVGIGTGAGTSTRDADAWTERVSKRLYGAANGLEAVEGLSEEEALDTLDYMLSHRNEAVQFLHVGQAYYQPNNSDMTSEEALDKCLRDLSRFSKRKKVKVSQV